MVAAAQSVIDGVARCRIERHRRGRKPATLLHADHDAARALLLDAAALYDKVHERSRHPMLNSTGSGLRDTAGKHVQNFKVGPFPNTWSSLPASVFGLMSR